MKTNPRLHQFKNLKLWFKLTEMPPLSHWPNRDQGPDSFDFKNSHVVQFIMAYKPTDNLRYAVSLFGQAKKIHCILFDPKTKLWHGNSDWEP